jgi:uncharacterized protein (TIGR02001 family)
VACQHKNHAVRGTHLILIAAAVLLLDATAFADELSGNLGVTTDYRFRGESLSNRLPAAQGGVDFDHSSGLYIGGFASTVRFNQAKTDFIGQLYGGYARKLNEGVFAEVGAVRYAYLQHLPQGGDFTEGYAGLSTEQASVRLYGTTSYFGSGAPAGYLEGSASRSLWSPLRGSLHLGFLFTGAADNIYSEFYRARRLDARAGVAFEYSGFQVELSAVAVAAAGGNCANGTHRCSPGVILTLRHGF